MTVTPGVLDRGRPLLRPIAAYCVSRVVVLLAVWYGVWARGGPSVLRALAEWDGSWYLSAAVQGYPQAIPLLNGEAQNSNVAFFPLYPTAVRAVSGLTGASPLLSSIVVATLGGLFATVLLWLFVRRICDHEVADRAALLFAFFPGSVVFSMAYSESLMLAMTLLCLYALLDRRWLGAGVAGMLATASRPNAVVVSLCCLYEAGKAVVVDRDWRALIAPALAPLGFVGFQLFLWSRTGDPLVWFRVQSEGWGEHFDGGIRTFEEIYLVATDFSNSTNTMYIQVIGLAFTLVAIYLLWRWRPPAMVAIYTAGVLVLCLGSWTLGARPRFILTAFPLIVAVARAARGRWFMPVLTSSAALMIVLAVVYTAPRVAVP